jgi:Zn-dependent peptidase ImmA (M78 family)/transcriptional regulator with XRE-family HTH domain
MEDVFAYRLMAARKMSGLSLQELSDKLGENTVSKQSLSKYEQGKMKPDSTVVIALANALGVSVDYFFAEPKANVALEQVEYRKFVTKVSKAEKDAIEERAKSVFERYFELHDLLALDEKPDYFTYNTTIKNAHEAEEAAKSLRVQWDLGYDPIPDVVEMLEDKGYKVIEVEAPAGFDGLKAIIHGEPVIALNKNKGADFDLVRKRFTALHELAHHAFTFPDEMKERDREHLCHAFASAVLYPEEMAKRELHRERFHFYEKELVILKERWGISISAIFSRAKQLGIINDYVYRKFHIGFRKRGYHLPGKEPGNYLGKETPTRMERLVFLGLAKEVLSMNEAAHFAGISSWKLREQMRQLV